MVPADLCVSQAVLHCTSACTGGCRNQGPSRTGSRNDQDAPERLEFRIVKFKPATRLVRIASEGWERLESQRPALIHRGVTTKTTKTLDTAKPACLLSDRQRPLLLILVSPPNSEQKEPDPPRSTHSYLASEVLH